MLFHGLRRLAGLMIAFALISAVATNGGPGLAARSMTGKSENGWAFFRLSQTGRRSLSDLFQEYVDQTSADIDEDQVTDESIVNGTSTFEDDDDDEDDES